MTESWFHGWIFGVTHNNTTNSAMDPTTPQRSQAQFFYSDHFLLKQMTLNEDYVKNFDRD